MSAPYYSDSSVTLWHGDCLEVMRTLPDASVDSVVTDPPYGIGFMGKVWDHQAIREAVERDHATRKSLGPDSDSRPGRAAPRSSSAFGDAAIIAGPVTGGLPFQMWCTLWAVECLRVLKPGGYFVSFGGTRTWHRLACAVEDAGFEIRDSIAWLYGSGFPKSLNVGKAIESGGGRPEDIRRLAMGDDYTPSGRGRVNYDHGAASAMNGSTEAVELSAGAQQWQGWGTALKPAFEPIVMGRKPLIGTVAANVLAHGTGALNIDGCRVCGDDQEGWHRDARDEHALAHGTRDGEASATRRYAVQGGTDFAPLPGVRGGSPAGRWPTNVILDESQAEALDRQTGVLTSGSRSAGTYGLMGYMGADAAPMPAVDGDSGGASRFFPTFHYEAKAPTSERPRHGETAHPTVKPVDLMRWLVRLVTPPGGTVLDPFAGSGTTAEACVVEGFRCVLIEREADYLPLIVQRLTKPIAPVLDFGASA